nr:putative ribonuclease H-like domain-containing protein [Tanacetum cinerariifolium]
QELHKIVKDENFPIINKVDARVQNFELQFLKEAAKFVGDFKSLAKEVDESLDKNNALELEIEHLLRAVVGETHALSKPVTLYSIPTPQESKVVKNDKVTAPGMFRINPFKTSREEKHVPNTVRASAMTKPITVSQPPVFTKKDVNSDSNGLSSTGIDNTKTRSPQPRSNTKNDRVTSVSTSSCNKNKGDKVEEHHRNLLLSKNKKHMPSACKNIKIDSQDVISKVVCAICKQCLISVNHDVCLRNYVNGKTSRGKKQKANVSIKKKQKKQQPKVKQTKKVGFNERLATPKPSKPRFFLRWSPTRRLFDLKGKIIASSESESQSDCSNGQFCDSDLEVAFRRNACFVRNLEGVDLLKRDRSTNLNTINLHEMPSVSPICLTARTSSTKSWLWHQRLSHLNFDTINDLAKNDLVSGLLKFKYHKEHLCPSCEQGKRKRASHPPKPVPNLRQRLHLLHMDLCGPMRIASINEKRTKKIMETMNVLFDELSAMAFEQRSSKPRLQSMTYGQISSGLDLTYAPIGSQLVLGRAVCDSNLKVAFRRDACFVRNLKGVGLLKGDRSTNLYTINLHDMASASPFCLMARALSNKSWLWHQRLSHLNFNTINDLARNDLVVGLPKFKFHKEHLCPSCEQGKRKRASHPPKLVSNSRQRLHLLHINLCGPMRIANINGKRYVLVIVDDYSRYTWIHFLRSKDEALEVIINFLKRITVLLKSPIIIIRTNNGTEFKNQVLKEYFDTIGISHQMSTVRTLQQNGVVERRNRTLVKAARTMLIFSRPPLFLWAEAIATACFT